VAHESAALVTTVTIGASTSDVAPPPPATGADGSASQPVGPPSAAGVPAGSDQRSTSDAQLTSVPPTAPGETAAAEEPGVAQGTGTAANDKQAAKESKQASKEAAKESKEAAKESKKAEKESKKAEKTEQPGE
jgi:hypothetical protein